MRIVGMAYVRAGGATLSRRHFHVQEARLSRGFVNGIS
jgi:hypothetical protein